MSDYKDLDLAVDILVKHNIKEAPENCTGHLCENAGQEYTIFVAKGNFMHPNEICGKNNDSNAGWINVNDARPDKIAGNKIWCFYDGTQFESEFDDGLWRNVFGDPFTHWMPLPSPPKVK